MKSEEFLHYFLVEQELLEEKEFQNLSETTKVESIREIAMTILDSINTKLDTLETTPIDKSRGDIKRMRELGSLQQAITQLETMIDRSEKTISPELKQYLSQIIKSIMYLNQYSKEFKEAYKNRRTLLILKYQSIIMSIFSAVSYLVSVVIDFSTGDVELKDDIDIELIAPIRSIMEFNKSVESGDFRMLLKRTTSMNEQFDEVDEEFKNLLEANEIVDVVMNGLKNILGRDSGKFIDFLYKASGVMVLILSMREIFYTLYRARTKFSEVLGSVADFANIGGGSTALVNKLNKFSQKFEVDAEESTKLADREIETENRMISSEIRSIPKRVSEPMEAEEIEKQTQEFDLGF